MRSDMMAQRKFFHLLVLVLVLVRILVTSSTQNLESKKLLSCLNSSDPEAVRASQLHGSHKETGLLWSRDPDASAPLPRCSSSSLCPPPSHCEVCVLGIVYMICHDLPANATLYLEDPPNSYITKRSACPTLPPADVPGPDDLKPSQRNCSSSSGQKTSYQFCLMLFFSVLQCGFFYSSEP